MSSLARKLGLTALIFYGIGDILGAGIYALVGKVVGIAGLNAWATFIVAALVAIFTGFSYAELSARYPVAGGAAAFVKRAFPGRLWATLIGVVVLGTGLVSAATVTVAFSNYLGELFSVPKFAAQTFLIFAMSAISFWGISESSRVNMVLTVVEVAGLIGVIVAGAQAMDAVKWTSFVASASRDFDAWKIVMGVSVAFYAYIGFEDLSNLAEEAKKPERDVPRAILIAIFFSTIVYILVTLALVIHIPKEAISQAERPLLLVFERDGFRWIIKYFAIIALMAITNTGLINLIMASRLMYGMAQDKLLPDAFRQIHQGRKTPWVGIIIAGFSVLLLVFTGSLKTLAQTTSFLIVAVFFFVHLSLIKVKWNRESHEGIGFHLVFPIVGAMLCLALGFTFPWDVYLRSLILIALGFTVWALQTRK